MGTTAANATQEETQNTKVEVTLMKVESVNATEESRTDSITPTEVNSMDESNEVHDLSREQTTADRDEVVSKDDGTVTVTLTPEQIDHAESVAERMAADADEQYKRRDPNDTRSLGERVDDAWQAHFNGGLDLREAICPYCGNVPAEQDADCCKPGRWLQLAAIDAAIASARVEGGSEK